MRVRGFSLARLRDDDQGAVLAIVAISLLVLLGMLVLTFDLGHGVALKRNMVNAADSGALAAARECGLANGEASATQAADQLIADNNASASRVGPLEFNPGPSACSGAGNPDPDGKNTVTVTVSVPQEYFFAQIFGFDGGTVVATATAEWTMELSGPAPLKVEALKVDECLSGGEGSSCYVGYDNSEQQWGWLNFPEGWPEEGESNPPTSCPSTGGANDLKDYVGQMGTGTSGFGPTLWNVPVWVCAKDGKNTFCSARDPDLDRQRRQPAATGAPAGRLLPRGGACERTLPRGGLLAQVREPGRVLPGHQVPGLLHRERVGDGERHQEGRAGGRVRVREEGPGECVLHRADGRPCRSEPDQRLPDSSADRLNLRRPAAEKT